MKTRIYFVLSGENLFHPYYFSDFLNKVDNNKYEVVGVTIPKEQYPKGILRFIRKQFKLWGLIGFIYIAFMDKYKNFSAPTKKIANRYKIPVTEVQDVNSKEHTDYLKSLNIDIIISSQGQIFKNEILNTARIACINRHTALLPMYGGSMPVFWAMFNKEKEFGVSIHYMVEKIDGGNILYQEVIPLSKDNSLFKNYILAFNKSAEITLKAIQNLMNGKITKEFYANDKQYFSFPKFKTIEEFKTMYKTFSISDITFFNSMLKIHH